MESNFIKERIVIREELIKKNLSKEKKKSAQSEPSTSGQNVIENPPKRVIVFEEFVNEGLRQELVVLSQNHDRICETISEYLKIKSAIKIMKTSTRDVRVQTNIGCNFYAQCHIDDASKIYLCIGKDYFLHLELEEALKMIDLIESRLTKELDTIQEKASKIKAYIKIALEAMGRLYEVDREKLID